MSYSENDIRQINEFREAVCRELATRLPERSLKFVSAMLAASDKPDTFKLFVRARHMITSERAELETKVKIQQIRHKRALEPLIIGIMNELTHYFHGGDKKVAEIQKPGIIH